MTEGLRVAAVVTAAGSAERFGGDKLFVDIAGDPLIDLTIRALVNGGVDHVYVVVPPLCERFVNTPMISARVDIDVHLLVNGEHAQGMFSSVKIGFAAADADAILVLPGDMPYVAHGTVRILIERFQGQPGIVSPRYRGKRGHPVVLPASLRREIQQEPYASNLHEVIKRHPDQRIDLEVDDPGITRDVDRPEDLAG